MVRPARSGVGATGPGGHPDPRTASRRRPVARPDAIGRHDRQSEWNSAAPQPIRPTVLRSPRYAQRQMKKTITSRPRRSPLPHITLGCTLFFIIGLMCISSAARAGSLYLADDDSQGGAGGVFQVGASGQAHPVAVGAPFINPEGLLASSSALLIADRGDRGGQDGRIFRLDPAVPSLSLRAEGGLLGEPRGMTQIGRSIFVADRCSFKRAAVIEIDSRSGRQRLVSRAGLLERPIALASHRGTLLVADYDAYGGHGGVIGVDPKTRRQRRISAHGFFRDPIGIAVTRRGTVYVADAHAGTHGSGAVIAVNLRSGRQRVIARSVPSPEGLGLGPRGELLIASGAGSAPGLISVNRRTGRQYRRSSSQGLVDAEGIAVLSRTLRPPEHPLLGAPGYKDPPPPSGLPRRCLPLR